MSQKLQYNRNQDFFKKITENTKLINLAYSLD